MCVCPFFYCCCRIVFYADLLHSVVLPLCLRQRQPDNLFTILKWSQQHTTVREDIWIWWGSKHQTTTITTKQYKMWKKCAPFVMCCRFFVVVVFSALHSVYCVYYYIRVLATTFELYSMPADRLNLKKIGAYKRMKRKKV